MKKETVYTVDSSAALLPFLLDHVPNQSRNSVKHLLSRGQVLVDGVTSRQFDLPLIPGQQITLLAQAPGPSLPFPVLYEDDGLIVIHKPAGLLSVATEKEKVRTAYRLVSDHLKRRDPKARIFVVHRLDRDTSGVLLFSKDETLKHALQDRWNNLVRLRSYWAIVEGNVQTDQGICRSALTENRFHKVYSTNRSDGKEAVTRYQVISRRKGFSLLDIQLDTGRKNQIRVQLSELGHPIIGDDKYGVGSDPLGRLGLHAWQLVLTDPRDGTLRSFAAPPPPEFSRLFPNLRDVFTQRV